MKYKLLALIILFTPLITYASEFKITEHYNQLKHLLKVINQ